MCANSRKWRNAKSLLLACWLPLLCGAQTVTGSLRGRVENWSWFDAPPADNGYTYGASVLRIKLASTWRRLEWQAEGAFPVMLNLPGTAFAPWPIGPLGYGGDYFWVNPSFAVRAVSGR